MNEPLPDSAASFEFFNSTLVNTTTLVDQVTGGSRLSGIDMANDWRSI